jgi:hypothetical protein
MVLLIGDHGDLRQVGGFLWVIRIPPPTKLTSRYNWNIVESAVTHNKPNHSLIFSWSCVCFCLCPVFLFTQCCQCLWIVHSWLPLRLSLTFIY